MVAARWTLAFSAIAYLALWLVGWLQWGFVIALEGSLCAMWGEMNEPRNPCSKSLQ